VSILLSHDERVCFWRAAGIVYRKRLLEADDLERKGGSAEYVSPMFEASMPPPPEPWFHGNISRAIAEDRLKAQGEDSGVYLVRIRGNSEGQYALSILAQGRPIHYVLELPAEEGQPILKQDKPMPLSWGTNLHDLLDHLGQEREDLKVPLLHTAPIPNNAEELLALASADSGGGDMGADAYVNLYNKMMGNPARHSLSTAYTLEGTGLYYRIFRDPGSIGQDVRVFRRMPQKRAATFPGLFEELASGMAEQLPRNVALFARVDANDLHMHLGADMSLYASADGADEGNFDAFESGLVAHANNDGADIYDNDPSTSTAAPDNRPDNMPDNMVLNTVDDLGAYEAVDISKPPPAAGKGKGKGKGKSQGRDRTNSDANPDLPAKKGGKGKGKGKSSKDKAAPAAADEGLVYAAVDHSSTNGSGFSRGGAHQSSLRGFDGFDAANEEPDVMYSALDHGDGDAGGGSSIPEQEGVMYAAVGHGNTNDSGAAAAADEQEDITYAAVDHSSGGGGGSGFTRAPSKVMTLNGEFDGFQPAAAAAPWLHDLGRKEAEAKLKAEGLVDGPTAYNPTHRRARTLCPLSFFGIQE